MHHFHTKWVYHKERSFTSNYLYFWKILFQFKNLLQRFDLIYQLPNAHIHTFQKHWIFI